MLNHYYCLLYMLLRCTRYYSLNKKSLKKTKNGSCIVGTSCVSCKMLMQFSSDVCNCCNQDMKEEIVFSSFFFATNRPVGSIIFLLHLYKTYYKNIHILFFIYGHHPLSFRYIPSWCTSLFRI